MKIHLYDRFDFKKLLRFTLPSIVMMIFTSIYTVIDGLFISNFVGTTPFAAVNLIYPFIMILGSIGFMFGAGGSALVSKLLGEGNAEKAKSVFSLIVYVTVALGATLAVIGIFVLRPIAQLLGAEGEMLEICVEYGRILLFSVPAFMLQFEFQSFFVTAEKPHFGLAVTLSSGAANIMLDAVLVAGLKLGVGGAAWATFASQIVGGALPLLYFFRKNSSLLRLGKTRLDLRALVKTCLNGSSELLTNVSASVVSMLYNLQLMKYAGENGVAAYGVMMYVAFTFQAVFIGYSVGCAPIVGYNYGAKNSAELKNVLKRSLVIIAVFSAVMLALAEALAVPLSLLFFRNDAAVYALTLRGFRIFAVSFLFAGIGIYGSSFFTALNNGLVSAVISALRTLVFQIAAVFVLPLFWKTDGVWASIVVAEVLSSVLSASLLAALRNKYGYGACPISCAPTAEHDGTNASTDTEVTPTDGAEDGTTVTDGEPSGGGTTAADTAPSE